MRRLALVEDSPAWRLLVRQRLARLGTLDEFARPDEFLALAADEVSGYDAVLIDWRFDRCSVDGFAVAAFVAGCGSRDGRRPLRLLFSDGHWPPSVVLSHFDAQVAKGELSPGLLEQLLARRS